MKPMFKKIADRFLGRELSRAGFIHDYVLNRSKTQVDRMDPIHEANVAGHAWDRVIAE